MRARWIVASGLVFVGLSAVAPQGAAARSFTTIPGDGAGGPVLGDGGPVLVGDMIAWTGPSGDPVIHADDGSGPREIGRLPAQLANVGGTSYPDPRRVVHLSADLLVVDYEHYCYSEACEDPAFIASETYNAVYVGRLGAPLRCVGGHQPPQACGEDPEPTGFSRVSGQTVAWPVAAPAGTGFTAGTFVRDFSPGAAAPDHATVALDRGAASGPWVAGFVRVNYSTPPTEIDVMNWRTQTTALRIAGLSSPQVLAVEPDGTVVYTSKYDSDTQAAFAASPSRPQPRRIVAPTSAYLLSAGGRILRFTSDDKRFCSVGCPPFPGSGRPDPATFEVFDLEGQVVARIDEPAMPGGFDIEGDRLAFGSRPCSVTRFVLQELTEPPVTRPQGRCPAARVRRRATWRGATARLRVACTDHAGLGCSGHVRLVATARADGRVRVRVLGRTGVSLKPGDRRPIRVRLKPRARRFLVAHPHARITAVSVGAVPKGTHRRPKIRRTRVRLKRR